MQHLMLKRQARRKREMICCRRVVANNVPTTINAKDARLASALPNGKIVVIYQHDDAGKVTLSGLKAGLGARLTDRV